MDYTHRTPGTEKYLIPIACKHEARKGRLWLKKEKYEITPEIATYLVDSGVISGATKRVPFSFIEKMAGRLTHLIPHMLGEGRTPSKEEILGMLCGGSEMLRLHHDIILKRPAA